MLHKSARCIAFLGACFFALAVSAADEYPSRPIKLLVGFGAGGTADSIARYFGQKISAVLNTPVIVDNRPGADQLIAIRATLAAPADGYTLYLATGSSLSQNPAMRHNLPYDPLKDFTLIGLIDTVPGVIFVNNDMPVHTVKELVDYAAAHPDGINFGSAGTGTAGHLSGAALMHATGMKATHIPYKADADSLREVMTGRLQFSIMPTLNAVTFIKAGKVRGIAVTTSKRLPYLPDVPSLNETGIQALSELEPHAFHTLAGPAGLPPKVVQRLSDALNQVETDAEFRTHMATVLYAEPAGGTPAELRTYIKKELDKWAVLTRDIPLAE